jgi:hypothetical protein
MPHPAWEFLRTRKKFWLPPLVFMLVVFGGMFLVAKGALLAPAIYAIISGGGG